jgi:hypothetical protein
VRAVSEREVPSGVRAADVEPVRGIEYLRVPVGAAQRYGHLVARAYPGLTEPCVRGRVPVHDGRRGLEPERFLDRGGYEVRVGPDQRQLFRAGEQVQHGVGDHAFGGLDTAEHQHRGVGDRFVFGERLGFAGERRRCRSEERPAVRCRDDLAQARGEFREGGSGYRVRPGLRRLDGGDDAVIPGEDRGRADLAQAERFGHHGDRQRPGDRPAEFGLALRLDGRYQPVCLGLNERREPRVHRVTAERGAERTAVVRVPGTIQREHARADDPGGRESRVVDRERPRIPEHADREIVAGDQPRAERRHPADRFGRAQPGQHWMRVGLQLGERDHVRRHACTIAGRIPEPGERAAAGSATSLRTASAGTGAARRARAVRPARLPGVPRPVPPDTARSP